MAATFVIHPPLPLRNTHFPQRCPCPSFCNPARNSRFRPQCTIPSQNLIPISPPQLPPPLVHAVPNHPDWHFMGPPLSEGPLPAIIYLALTSSQSLQLPPFNHPACHAITLSTTPLRIFSVTLPFHGSMLENEAALSTWASLYSSGGDPVSNFVRRVSHSLNCFIDAGHIIRNAVVMAGLSRGALLAALVAAKNEHVRACVGFSPVTVLGDLKEFRDVGDKGREKVHKASLMHDDVVKGLRGIPLRFYMGNLDRRVGTKNAFELVHLLAEEAAQIEGLRSPPHEFFMYCSIGKDGHGTPPDVFEAGAEYAVSHINDLYVENNN